MVTTEEVYIEIEKLLSECRELALAAFGTMEAAEQWLHTETDSFWNKSPVQCIAKGEGEEVRRILQEKVNLK